MPLLCMPFCHLTPHQYTFFCRIRLVDTSKRQKSEFFVATSSHNHNCQYSALSHSLYTTFPICCPPANFYQDQYFIFAPTSECSKAQHSNERQSLLGSARSISSNSELAFATTSTTYQGKKSST